MKRGRIEKGRPFQHAVINRIVALILMGGCMMQAGCQSLGTYRPPTWMGSFRPSRPAPSKSATVTKPLTGEQKADMQFALGRNAEARGEIDVALDAYRESVQQDDLRGDAYHRLALLHERKGDLKQADEYYTQALQRAPENPDLHCDLGYCLYLQGKFPEAEARYVRALQLRSDFPRAHTNYGLLLARTGRDEEALRAFFQAGISESQARLNLAFAMVLENRTEDARQQLLLARQLDASPASVKRITQLDSLLANTQEPRRLPTAESLARRPGQELR